MKNLLKDLTDKASGFVEMRYHKRQTNSFVAQKGRVDVANQTVVSGIGIRAMVDGSWGFAATSDLTEKNLKQTIEQAQKNARILAETSERASRNLPKDRLATEDFVGEGFNDLVAMSVSDKLSQVIDIEKSLGDLNSKIQSSRCRYNEILEEKVIVTSDGAEASLKIAQPEVSIAAVAANQGQQISSGRSAGVSGNWQCLFNHPSLNHMVEQTGKLAVDLLKADYPEGGLKNVILAPAVVGLLCHEAIGHTVEADFVKSGSIAQGKIGTKVASDIVTLCDSGIESISGYATGNIPFDDEGVKTENTIIIKNGLLNSYLHNRESAAEFGVAATGNARAWLYNDEPIIRMRNTYMAPGQTSLDQMIAEMEDGYLVEGAGGGQADANGEFMFGCSHVWKIKNGKKVQLLREATLSGIAFDVLKTIDAISSEFLWDLGSGYCGKGQPAKVDAGGPYVRCKMHVGGR